MSDKWEPVSLLGKIEKYVVPDIEKWLGRPMEDYERKLVNFSILSAKDHVLVVEAAEPEGSSTLSISELAKHVKTTNVLYQATGQ